ncbi:MAG: divalent-cation tolerance protein CutA [Alphaproteobacteria bacterium]
MTGDNTKYNTAGQQDGAVVLIYTTFPLQSQAQNIGRNLVEAGLAACVNIFPGMTSVYSWQGKVEQADETVMIIKTARSRTDEILAYIERYHPDDVPAQLVLPVIDGGKNFLDWILKQTAER